MSTAEMWMVALTGLGLLVTAAGVGVTYWAMRKVQEVNISNKTLDVRMNPHLHETFASKSEFLEHVRDNDRQRGILHKRMDDAIKDYNEKFQALPNEIVALLRNTGNLK